MEFLDRMGVYGAVRQSSPTVLPVLAYHRVEDIHRPGFDTFATNVTASPAEFQRQVDYLQRNYHVITCAHLAAWLRGERDLPPYAAVITFDDGYADNYTYAYPILKARSLPAVFFLVSDFMGTDTPWYWDRAAYCFAHSQKTSAALPLLGPVSWASSAERRRVVKRWVGQAKHLPEAERQRALSDLPGALGVNVPGDAFAGLYLSWDQVREMSQNGMEFGSHTADHPILTHIPLAQVEQELVNSREKIEAEIGKPVIAFAYPNGGYADFSSEVTRRVAQAGYQVAFTLIGGAARYAEVRKNPLAIRRIPLSGLDTFPRFLTKLMFGRIISDVKSILKDEG